MPDRHSELPAHPDLEYYRKQAKHLLRSYEAGDAAARARAADVLGDRAAGRFLGAEGLGAVLFATDRHDPVIRQLHELLKPRSAELPPQVPSRRSPSVDRTTGAVRPCRNLQSATRSTRPS